jgi:hypothetical protein
MNSEPFSNFGQPAQTEKLDRLRWRACHRQSVERVRRASRRVVGLGKPEVERSVNRGQIPIVFDVQGAFGLLVRFWGRGAFADHGCARGRFGQGLLPRAGRGHEPCHAGGRLTHHPRKRPPGGRVTAYPVDFRTGDATSLTAYSMAQSLLRWQTSLHEWLGLAVYGWTR